MLRNILFQSRALALMKGGLDAGTARMRAIGQNVANVATPGYEAQRVKFEELIRDVQAEADLRTTHPDHLSGTARAPGAVPQYEQETDATPPTPGAVNNVDMEQELVLMKQNEMHYQALSQLLARKYQGIRDAIR